MSYNFVVSNSYVNIICWHCTFNNSRVCSVAVDYRRWNRVSFTTSNRFGVCCSSFSVVSIYIMYCQSVGVDIVDNIYFNILSRHCTCNSQLVGSVAFYNWRFNRIFCAVSNLCSVIRTSYCLVCIYIMYCQSVAVYIVGNSYVNILSRHCACNSQLVGSVTCDYRRVNRVFSTKCNRFGVVWSSSCVVGIYIMYCQVVVVNCEVSIDSVVCDNIRECVGVVLNL